MTFKILTKSVVEEIFSERIGGGYLVIIDDGLSLRKKLLKVLLTESEVNPGNIANVFTDFMKLNSISDDELNIIVKQYNEIRELQNQLRSVTMEYNENMIHMFGGG